MGGLPIKMKIEVFMFEKFNEMVRKVSHEHIADYDSCSVKEQISLLQTAATLILAEEIHNLSTSAVTLSQATTDLATAAQALITEIKTATDTLTAALAALPVATTPDESAAVAAIENVVTNLNAATSGVQTSAAQIQAGLANLEQIPAAPVTSPTEPTPPTTEPPATT